MSETGTPNAVGHGLGARRHRRVAPFVAGSIACVFALVFLAGGAWALWKDRVDRDASGFVTIGSATLRTDTYAIVGDLHGDGPSWLWGSAVLGDTRVRATSQSARPLFIGIARTDDVFRYLEGAGYSTIDNFEVTADTTHAGGAPPGPPSRESFWAASTHGTGRQTLRWDSRSGDWSVVLMNASAGARVAVHGDAAAKLPVLPWIAAGLLIVAVALGALGTWLLVRAIRRVNAPAPDRPTPSSERSPTMDRYRDLLEHYVERYNAGDLDGVMDLYADDAVQLMPDGTFEGRTAIKDRLAQELAAFSDIAHRYVSYVEQGDAFADEFVFVGTHTGPLVLPDGTQLAATGKRVEMPGMELVRVRDGKIVVDNLYYDNLAVAAQFGLLPQPATTS